MMESWKKRKERTNHVERQAGRRSPVVQSEVARQRQVTYYGPTHRSSRAVDKKASNVLDGAWKHERKVCGT